MAVVATDILAGPVAVLRAMLAECATFQALVQADDADEAAENIFQQGEAGDAARPFAFVRLKAWSPEAIGAGEPIVYAPAGTLELVLEADVRTSGAVTTKNSTTVFRDSSKVLLPDDYFNGKTLEFDGGGSALVSDFDGDTGEFTLTSALPAAPDVGDTYEITASNPDAAETNYLKYAGAILAELLDLSGTSECLSLRDPMMQNYGRAEDDADEDDFVGAVIELGFGV